MSDPLDRLRAANPVPEPPPFASAARRRMIAAIVTHDPAPVRARFGGLVRRLSRRRLYVILVAALLAAGCTAGAVEVLQGDKSAPLSGALPGPPGGTYSFSVIPSLGAGTVGWCIGEETQTPPPTLLALARKLRSEIEQVRAQYEAELLHGRLSAARRRALTGYVHGAIPDALRSLTPARYRSSPLLREFAQLAAAGEGSGGCPVAAALGRPIIATMNAGAGRRHVTLYLTAPDVAAVRVSATTTVLTSANRQLPGGYRFAVVAEPGASSGTISNSPPFRVVALNSAGSVIASRRALPGQVAEPTISWQRRRGPSASGPAARLDGPPPAACEIGTHDLTGAKLYYGSVVAHVHSSLQLEGRPYLSCAYTQFYYRGYTVQAAVLLDARNPGEQPAPLPDAEAVRSQPVTVNEPQIGVQQPITGRRIGDAWLVVESMSNQGHSPLTERLAVLDKLTVCVRLHGPLCP